MRSVFLIGLGLASPCTGCPPWGRMPEPQPEPAPDPVGPRWPFQPDAAWPASCLLENVAPHPTAPWVAVACTASADPVGAVLVFDAAGGVLRSATATDDYVGWSHPGLLRWHPDGERLATNISTNGIARIDAAAWAGRAHPDDLRDHGVGYAWFDDRMFADTGAFFTIRPADRRFDFVPQQSPFLWGLRHHEGLGAIVGRTEEGFAAYDPVGQRVVWARTMEGPMRYGDSCAPDARACAWMHFAVPPAPDEILVVDGDDGSILGAIQPASPRIARRVWGPDGLLALSTYRHVPHAADRDHRVEVFSGHTARWHHDLGERRITATHATEDAGGLAFSPDGRTLAVLLDGGEVLLLDARSGVSLAAFPAPAAPLPPGLPQGYRPEQAVVGDLIWAGNDHIVRLGGHFVSVWSRQGRPVAEWVVPTL